jgi:hypothetical protein
VRHCERSEAIQTGAKNWIASSQALLAMTGKQFVGWAKALFAPCPPFVETFCAVGTLRFAHPTGSLARRAELQDNWHRARAHQPLEKVAGPDDDK